MRRWYGRRVGKDEVEGMGAERRGARDAGRTRPRQRRRRLVRGERPRAQAQKLVDGHVDSTSLPECACDPGHYTTEGQRRLGERFAHWVLDQGEDDSQ